MCVQCVQCVCVCGGGGGKNRDSVHYDKQPTRPLVSNQIHKYYTLNTSTSYCLVINRLNIIDRDKQCVWHLKMNKK